MGYHPRIETTTLGNFVTTRSRNSELWFVNNQRLEESILGYAAKFSKRYHVRLYGFAIEGNHTQFPAHFPQGQRADFMRDLNSCIARAVPRHTPEYRGGRFWGRRYSCEYLPGEPDIEEWFFYTVLQPVHDGLVERISDYPGYNCFHDAVHGIKRKFKVVNWAAYNAARRFNPWVALKDFTETVELKYARLPGYEDLSQKEYAKIMKEKLEYRRQEIVKKRKAEGKGFMTSKQLKRVKRGTVPKRSKHSTTESKRPRILSVCPRRRKKAYAWYFAFYNQYKEASRKYRSGEKTARFPEGTYRPPILIGSPQRVVKDLRVA